MLSLVSANVAYLAPAGATMLGASRIGSVVMQESKGFQDADVVAKDAANAAKAGEFCYGLPGSIDPIKEFDPFQYTNDATFDQVRHAARAARPPAPTRATTHAHTATTALCSC